jgi:eukaryotic-like serine/threonine-protein kinase
MTVDPRGFPGNARFQIERCLGSGGMGVVYEALDRERNEVVALKTIRWTDPTAIYRLKREFRTLVGMVHPNLVALYELFGEADEWYFTMELVPGCRFLEFVRPDGLAVDRLRQALGQLATGLVTLHRAGKLHRDLKPSNVLVTPTGRLVILDFGIAADVVHGDDPLRTAEDGIWGTAEYMSPEQARGEASESSDWYAMGCMLYEALTGRLPFTGPALRVLFDKGQQDVPDPSKVTPALPSDLGALCRELMAREPERRPPYREILRRLGVAAPTARSTLGSTLLFGRDAQLAELEQAFELARSGRPVLTLVRGPSGIGKTALVRRFLEQLMAEDRAVVLPGRCYVRESVPYKGLDSVIDSLTRFLRTLPDPELDRLISPDLATVLPLFPVLGRVPRMLQLPIPSHDVVDPVALRRRRFRALQGLFRRIGSTKPVVIHIDDLQWGDAESIMLLDALLAPPDPPALLVIVSFSSEETDSPPVFLKTLLSRTGSESCRDLVLSPLPETDSRRLAQALLDTEGRAGRGSGGTRVSGGSAAPALPAGEGSDGVDAIVREAAGNPFLMEQLVHYLPLLPRAGAPLAATTRVTLGDVLDARLAQLPGGARPLLETLALAGQPLDAAVARDVAGLVDDERQLVALLQAERWLKATRPAERLDLYHDGIRRALLARIEPARVPKLHLSLATAMEARGAGDPETLYEHYFEAGQRVRALGCAKQAAAKATRALAFERAALFYRRALTLAPEGEGGGEVAALYAQLGEALANAGRVRDAAEAYSRAAALSNPSDALELRRLSAEQFLIGGRIREGLDMLGSVLDATGLGLSKTMGRAVTSLLWHRVWLRLRGLHFVERPAAAIPPAQLARIDVCRTVAEGLGHIDTLRAADFQTRHLLLALAAGEPDRLARALALEGGFTAALGGRSRWYERLFAEAEGLGRRIQSPHALGLRAVMAGMASYFAGEFERARDATQQAEELLLEHGVGVAWELVTARFYHTVSLYYLGDVEELTRCRTAFLKDAAERGNRFATLMFSTGPTNAAWLFADDVAGARRAMTEALAEWPEQPFGSPHYMAMTARGRIELYAGTPRDGWDAIERSWPALTHTGLFRIQSVRIAARQIRATCGIGTSRGASGAAARLLGAVERDAAAIAAERAPYSAPMAALITAAVAAGRGQTDAAVRSLRAALTGFDSCHMKLFLAVTRRRLGELVGGDEGRALVHQANAWMAAHGIVNSDRVAATLAPGFPD